MALDFPTSPTNGQVYGNFVYSTAKGAWQAKPITGKVTTSATAPSSPSNGDEWFNTNDGNIYVYYTDVDGSQWVQVKSDATLSSTLGTRVTSLEATPSGLIPVTPTSIVAISSGSASVGTNGLVTFTGVTGIQLNGVFTAAYKNYRVLVNHDASTSMNVGVRFGTNGTRETGTSYQLMGGYATQAAGFAGWTGQNQSYIQTGSTDSVPGSTTLSTDVLNPFTASRRSVLNFQSSGWSGTYRGVFGSGLDANETSRTDISYESTAGTITGTIQVYGYR